VWTLFGITPRESKTARLYTKTGYNPPQPSTPKCPNPHQEHIWAKRTSKPFTPIRPKVGDLMENTLKLRSKLFKNKTDRLRGLRLVSCVDDGHGHLIIPNCPFCGQDHWHGALPGDTRRDRGPRGPHCGNGASAGREYRLWCVHRPASRRTVTDPADETGSQGGRV
jgi:hypothetical protein